MACRSLGINTTNTKLTAFCARRHVRRACRLPSTSPRAARASSRRRASPSSESALILAIVVLGGMGSQFGVAIAAVVLIGGTELLRELDWMKQIFGPRFRADALPHAAVRPGHGAGDDLEAARPDLHAHALHLPAPASRRPRRPRRGGTRLMAAAARPPLLTVEHLTMRFGGLVADRRPVVHCPAAARSPPSSAPTAPARRPSSTASPVSTSRPADAWCCAAAVSRGRPTSRHYGLRPQMARHAARRSVFLLERMPDFEIAHARQGRPHVPEHPPVSRHDRAGEPDRRAAQRADAGLGLDRARACRRAQLSRRRRRSAVERAKYWLEKVALIDRADDPAGDLPYGAQRRLEIVRAMCTEPQLLCLDEPAAGLNPRESAELKALLRPSRPSTAPPSC